MITEMDIVEVYKTVVYAGVLFGLFIGLLLGMIKRT